MSSAMALEYSVVTVAPEIIEFVESGKKYSSSV